MAGSGDGVLNSAPAAGDVAPVDLVSDDEDDVIDLDAANADDVVANRIKRFIEAKKFPSSINGAELKNLKKTTSFLNECGIRLLDNSGCEYFICMLDPCFDVDRPTPIKCTRSGASNATKHMRDKHDVTSSKTAAANRRTQDLQKQIDMSNPTFRRDPLRWFQVY